MRLPQSCCTFLPQSWLHRVEKQDFFAVTPLTLTLPPRPRQPLRGSDGVSG